MAQQHSMNGLDTGNRLNQDPVLQLLFLSQLEKSVQIELKCQNDLLKGDRMKEVRDLASGMKEAIANVRKASADAKTSLDAEIIRAQVNADKVRSFARDLKDANQEVESFLGDTGSNFPTSDNSVTQQPGTADINGVTINQEYLK